MLLSSLAGIMPSLLLIKAVYCLGSKSMLGALWNWHSLSRRVHSLPAAQDSTPFCLRFHSFCNVYFLFSPPPPLPPSPPWIFFSALAYVYNNLTFTFDLLTADWRCLRHGFYNTPGATVLENSVHTNNKACLESRLLVARKLSWYWKYPDFTATS